MPQFLLSVTQLNIHLTPFCMLIDLVFLQVPVPMNTQSLQDNHHHLNQKTYYQYHTRQTLFSVLSRSNNQ